MTEKYSCSVHKWILDTLITETLLCAGPLSKQNTSYVVEYLKYVTLSYDMNTGVICNNK